MTDALVDPTRASPLSASQVREAVGEPSALVLDKQLDHLDPHARAFIALSPFCVISSAGTDGRVDASPRGDPPGFVSVLDDRTLVVPDRPGNRRADTMRNVAEQPHLGMLFLIPGTPETLRVNGRARVTDDVDLLARCEVAGKTPTLGIVVAVEEVFMHCARAILRGGIWNSATWPERSALPTLGQILHDQINGTDMTVEELDQMLDESNQELY